MGFKGSNVVITGASSGIGREAAIQFAKKGANVAVIARRAEKLREVEGELRRLGANARSFKCDVSDRSQVADMRDAVLGEFGGVDVLVNNAGFAVFGTVSKLTLDEIESQMATNYLGMAYCTKQFLPGMLERQSGHIVNVASVGASFGLPGVAPYCASKFAILGFSEGLKHELRGTGIGVTVVSPIVVRTGFFDGASFADMPKYPAASISAETAARAILQAAGSPRLEIIVPPLVRGAVWAKHTFPFLVNRIAHAAFKKYMSAARKT